MEAKSNSMDRISVIISAFNKNDVTVVHVREIMNSTLIPDEIIVVNDCGEPDLREKLMALDKKTKIIYAYILPPKILWNYTGARNLGMFISRGDFISIEDNDHIPEREYYADCMKAFVEHPEWERLKSWKRHVVSEEDVLTKPYEEWVQMGSRVPHEDVAFNRREVFSKLKGYDERFAGEYGWCSTDLTRRMKRVGIVIGNAGYQKVVFSEKTRGLSYRNFRLCRTQQGTQPPEGMIKFSYTYELLNP